MEGDFGKETRGGTAGLNSSRPEAWTPGGGEEEGGEEEEEAQRKSRTFTGGEENIFKDLLRSC